MRYLGFGLLFLAPVLALQANLAGIVDWHKPLIGAPLLIPSPPLHVENKVVLVTKKNVLASLDASSGDIVWRHQLDSLDPVVSFHLGKDVVLLLSGPSASTARLFSLSTGHALWERRLLDEPGLLTTPAHLGTDAVIKDDIYILSGRCIHRLSLNGEIIWKWEDSSAGMLLKQLIPSDKLYVLAITSSFASSTLSYLSLDISTGEASPLTHIPSSIVEPSHAHLLDQPPRAVWLEDGRIKQTALDKVKPVVLPRNYRGIEDVGVRGQGYIIGRRSDGGVDVLSGKGFTEFEGSEDAGDKSPSTLSASIQPNGVLFSRIYWSFALDRAVAQSIAVSSGSITSGFTFPFDTTSHGVILHAAITPVDKRQLPSLIITTSSGAIQHVNNDKISWTREESLADIAAVRFIDLGEPEVEEVREILSEEAFFGRTLRHISELKGLPGYILRFAKRFTTGSYSKTVATTPLTPSYLHRDQFGFQKLLTAVTRGGKVYAMDSANGNTVWSRNLGRTTDQGSELEVLDMYLVRDLGEKDPVLAVVGVKNGMTYGYYVDGLTGDAGELEDGIPIGKVICQGKPSAVFVTPFENCGTQNKVIAVVQGNIMHIFPKCKKVAAGLLNSSLSYTTVLPSSIQGYSPMASAPNITLETSRLWSIPVQAISVSPVKTDKIASYGRVLGDKTTLYKYMNPHLTVVTSSTHVYVVDALTGSIIHSAQVESARAIMVENWLVYAWSTDTGHRITSVELYEGDITFSKTFVIPSPIKIMSFTTSKFGVAAKELVYVNGLGQVASIPRRLLDPRRPTGKPTTSDREDMLIPFDPFLAHDAKRIVSHAYPVLGIDNLVSSPALLESTSLLFAYGLDLFLTRGLTPSGTFDILSDSFNKVQLLLTLGGLIAGIAAARPAVQRKMLRGKWY